LHLDRAALHSNLGHIADLVRDTEINLQDDTDSKYHLGLFDGKSEDGITDRWEWYPVLDTSPTLVRPLVHAHHILTEGSEFVEIFLRHPKCA
jgi:hypothetical protein